MFWAKAEELANLLRKGGVDPSSLHPFISNRESISLVQIPQVVKRSLFKSDSLLVGPVRLGAMQSNTRKQGNAVNLKGKMAWRSVVPPKIKVGHKPLAPR